MKFPIFCLLVGMIFMGSCKKDEGEPAYNGEYPGKIASINGQHYVFHYTEDGLLAKYKYSLQGVVGTAKLTWEEGQVTCNDGIGYTYVRPRNAAGYALPGTDDQQAGNSWTYNSLNQVTSIGAAQYHWSNGNIDSLTFGSTLATYEYLSDLDTRDFGAQFVPELTNFPFNNLNLKNLPSKMVQYDGNGDTLHHILYSYTYDANGRISSQLSNRVVNGDTLYLKLHNYTYYE